MKEKKISTNEFHAYWQCPNCGVVNMDIADDFIIIMKTHQCTSCKKEYILKKEMTQVLCQPMVA